MEDQCSICLSPLPTRPKDYECFFSGKKDIKKRKDDNFLSQVDDIAYLESCKHFFHHQCIRSWMNIANTCPVCRNRFYWIQLSQFIGDSVFASYPVENRINPGNNDTLDLVEGEDICRCIICGSFDDENVLLLCDQCDDAYHTYCLGLDEVPDTDFFCMTCINLSKRRFSRTSRHSTISGRSMSSVTRQRVGNTRNRRRVGIPVASTHTNVFSSISSNTGVRSGNTRRIFLDNNWVRRACRDDILRCAWNFEVQNQEDRTFPTSPVSRNEASCNSGKAWLGSSDLLSPEEKAWEMYEVQKSGEKFEKYKDNLLKDDISSSSSQRKFKRPLIAKSEIRNMKYNLKECITRTSDDTYHIAHVKGKIKEDNCIRHGFLQNLLNDISNSSNCSSE